MVSYVALLRGVNVGGVRVDMADLRSAGKECGFAAVSTVLNSGNLVFSAEPVADAALAEALRAALARRTGRSVPVLVRTGARLAAVYSEAGAILPDADPATLSVAFLDRPAGTAADLGEWPVERYALCAGSSEVVLHYPDGQARSKLTLDVIERRLRVTATVRGLGTVRRLADKTA